MKPTKPLALSLSLAAAMLSVGATANAEVLATVDDTFVREDFGTSSSRGLYPNLEMRTETNTAKNHLGYLRFDTSSLQQVTAASLQWFWYDNQSVPLEVTVYALNDGVSGEVWDEQSLTYNTAPGLDQDGITPQTEANNGASETEIQDLDLSQLTLIAPSTEVTQVEGQQYTVPAQGTALIDFLNADTNGSVTFIIAREALNTTRLINLTSKDAESSASGVLSGEAGDFAPTLTVTTVPEPGSLGLIATGLACLFSRRRHA